MPNQGWVIAPTENWWFSIAVSLENYLADLFYKDNEAKSWKSLIQNYNYERYKLCYHVIVWHRNIVCICLHWSEIVVVVVIVVILKQNQNHTNNLIIIISLLNYVMKVMETKAWIKSNLSKKC